MRLFLAALMLILWISTPGAGAAQGVDSTPEASPTAPAGNALPPGQTQDAIGILQPPGASEISGVADIRAVLPAQGLTSLSLSFTYEGDTSGAWFPIALLAPPYPDGVLAQWDTTTLTDGYYTLRLRLFMADGVLESTVTGVRIRNYSLRETETPSPSPTASPTPPPTASPPAPSATPSLPPTAGPSATPLPPNPASLPAAQIWVVMAKAALATLATFLIFGGLLALSQKLRS